MRRLVEDDNSGYNYVELFRKYLDTESGLKKLSDGSYEGEIYVDYRNTRLDCRTLKDIFKSGNPMDNFMEMLDEIDIDSDYYEYDSLAEGFRDYLYNQGIPDFDDDIYDLCDEVGGVYFHTDPKNFFEKYHCRVEIDTGDGNTDFTLNYCSDDFDGSVVVADNSENRDNASMYWLAETQGNSTEQVEKAFRDKDSPLRKDKFLMSLVDEAASNTGCGGQLVFLGEANLKDMLSWYNHRTPIKIPAGTMCGFVDLFNGNGGPLGIEIERGFTIPARYVSDFLPDCVGFPYGVDSIYGLSWSNMREITKESYSRKRGKKNG